MSLKDYNQKYIVINGTTNEQIVVPKVPMIDITVTIPLNDYVLYRTYKDELRDCEAVSIIKTYMKD